MKTVTQAGNYDITDRQLEFIKDLYYGLKLSDQECVERFTIACMGSFIEPSDIMKLAENTFRPVFCEVSVDKPEKFDE